MSAGSSALVQSASWIERLVTGSFSSSLAVIAVAVIGMLMLRGRIPLEAAFRLVMGCFIALGAPAIALGLIDATQNITTAKSAAALSGGVNLPRPHADYDPYAGAAAPVH